MKQLSMLILIMLLSSVLYAVEAPKGNSSLGSETDSAKIQELFLTTNYEKMTESEYVAAIKNLGTLVRAADIASENGKKDFAIIFNVGMNLSAFLSQGGPKNYTKEKQKKEIDTMIANMKNVKKTDLKGAIDMFFQIDEAKMKQEYQRILTVRTNYKKSLEPTKENLIVAVQAGRAEIVEALIKAKVDVNIKDKNNKTPLMNASISGYAGIVKLLIDAKADVNVKDEYDNTPLIIVCGADHNNSGRVEIAKYLIAGMAKLNEKNKNGMTALIGAAFQGNVDIVKMLIAAKADLKMKDSEDYTALKMATAKGFPEVAELLKKAGAKE